MATASHIGEFAHHQVSARGAQPLGVIFAAFANAGNAVDKDALTKELTEDPRFSIKDGTIALAQT